MISVLATNITSPLGFTTEENYRAVLSGTSALKRYEGLWGLPEPFAASLFTEEQRAKLEINECTFFEALAIRSIRDNKSAVHDTSVFEALSLGSITVSKAKPKTKSEENSYGIRKRHRHQHTFKVLA